MARINRLNRRVLLLLTLVGVRRSRAQTASSPARVKASLLEAHYQDHPRDGMSCDACTFFRRPHSCQVVDGNVSRDGWCQLFDMPD